MTDENIEPEASPDDFDPNAIADNIRRQGIPSDFDAVIAAILAD